MNDRTVIAWLGGGAAVIVLLIAVLLPRYLASRSDTATGITTSGATATNPAPEPAPAQKASAPISPPSRALAQPLPSAKVYGGAWVTRKNGQSDLLRGLDVHLIARQADPKKATVALAVAIDEATAIIEKEKKGRTRYVNGVLVVDHKLTNLEEGRMIDRMHLEEMKKRLAGGEPVDVRELHKLSDQTTRDLVTVFDWFSAGMKLVGKDVVDVDGKYNIPDIPAGDYYLSAVSANSAFFIEWLVPIALKGKDLRRDLSNDNAEVVRNFR